MTPELKHRQEIELTALRRESEALRSAIKTKEQEIKDLRSDLSEIGESLFNTTFFPASYFEEMDREEKQIA